MSELIDTMTPNKLKQMAGDLCETALNDAKAQLHPLLQQAELERLDQRCEFIGAFKNALEQAIARKIVTWLPHVQAVYRFDTSRKNTSDQDCWDSTIHLLILVPELFNPVGDFAKKLDHYMLKQLRRLRWSRFQKSTSIIEIQQVTPDEVRHQISYGAMFLSLYAAPVQVWPSRR